MMFGLSSGGGVMGMLPWVAVAVLLVIVYMWWKDDARFTVRRVDCNNGKCVVSKSYEVPWDGKSQIPSV